MIELESSVRELETPFKITDASSTKEMLESNEVQF